MIKVKRVINSNPNIFCISTATRNINARYFIFKYNETIAVKLITTIYGEITVFEKFRIIVPRRNRNQIMKSMMLYRIWNAIHKYK